MRGLKKTLAVDSDNPILSDMHLTAGDATEVDGDDATFQELRSRLLLPRGSFFNDENEGLPYFEEILEKGTTNVRIKQLLRQAILTHPAIVDVPVLELVRDRASRSGTVVFEARTLAGTIIRSEDFGPVEVI